MKITIAPQYGPPTTDDLRTYIAYELQRGDHDRGQMEQLEWQVRALTEALANLVALLVSTGQLSAPEVVLIATGSRENAVFDE